MSLWKSYLRWRHSKGYGVHSPYAYRFVTDVIRPGTFGYYSYHRADRIASNPKYATWRKRNRIYFFIRLLVFLGSKRVLLIGNENIPIEIAAKAVGIQLIRLTKPSGFKFQGTDLLLIDNLINENNDWEEIIDASLKAGSSIFVLRPSLKLSQILERPGTDGLLLMSANEILRIPRSEMSFVSYPINFRSGL